MLASRGRCGGSARLAGHAMLQSLSQATHSKPIPAWPGPFLLGLILALGAGGGCTPAAPEGVLLIVVDTLRADHLGIHGYSRATSPRLDDWSREALVFDEAWSTSSWTLPAFGSILTGLYPHRHGAGRLHPEAKIPIPSALDERIPTLPQVLAARGWKTVAVINNPFLHERFGLNRGFQTYDFAAADNNRLRRADASVDQLLERLGGLEPPFFVMLHLFDPHLAYDPPATFRGRFSQGAPTDYPVRDLASIRQRAGSFPEAENHFIQAAYDEEIAFVDEQLGRLFDALDRRGSQDRMLIVITSDHGEEFFEHGGFEHGHSLHQEVARVPLLARGPRVHPGRSSLPVSLADLAPTILDAFSLPPLSPADGVSLWSLLTGGEQLAPRGLRAEGILWGAPQSSLLFWPHRLLVEPELSRVRLYDLKRDPGETRDLSASRPDLLNPLLERWEAGRQPQPDWKLPDLDQETLDQLKSLGYIQ